MSPRYLLLVVGSVLVLGLGVYLFVAVHETPARAQAAPPDKPGKDGQDSKAPETHARRAATPPPTVAANDTSDEPKAVIDHEPSALPPPPPSVMGRPGVSGPANKLLHPAEGGANPKMEAIMSEANKAYDRGDYDEAKAIAGKVLAKQPDNVRMLRIMTTIACIDGDKSTAQNYYNKLPTFDQNQMKTRCGRDNGITFDDPPAQK